MVGLSEEGPPKVDTEEVRQIATNARSQLCFISWEVALLREAF